MLMGDSSVMGGRTSTLKRMFARRDGAAAAEFALILPLMLLIVAGALQYGVMMMTYTSMLNGARSAARALSLGDTTPSQAQAAVVSWMPSWVPAAVVTVTPVAIGTDRVRVDVSMPAANSTVFRLGPMPATLDVSVLMMRED